MSSTLIAASVVLLATAVAHSILGEVLLLRHLGAWTGIPKIRGSDLFFKRTLRAVWHLPTVLGAAFAALLLEAPVLRTTAAALLGCAAIMFAVTRGKHAGWVMFLIAAALTWLGTR